MAWSFNPFTGNLDIVGGGAVVFEGEVETFAELPETVGDPAVGASFLVRSSTGVWLVNRRQAGIWIRRNNTGVRATDWEYGGDYPVNSVNGQTGNVSLGSSDVAAEPIDYTVVTTATTLANGAKVAANTTAGAFTLTLPASPSNGDTVSILDYAGTFDTNNLTIARNGSNIESLAENMDCNIEDAAFSLVFVGSTVGWKVVPYFGNKTNFASPDPIGSSVRNTGAFTSLTANTVNASNGTLTASAPVLDLAQTWNNSGVTFTGLRFNVTETAAAQGCRYFSIDSSGTSIFSIQTSGASNGSEVVRLSGPSRGFLFGLHGTSTSTSFFSLRWQQNLAGLASNAIFAWGSDVYNLQYDLAIQRDGAADTLAQRRGTAAQTFRLYNTFTDASNHERGFMRWSSNVLQIGTEKAGTGSARALEFQTDGVTRMGISTGGTVGFGPQTGQSTALIGWSGNCFMRPINASAGVLTLLNAALDGFNRLQFGGTTSSFPALKRDSTVLQVRLADDSAYSVLDAQLRAQGTAPATSGAAGTAGDIRYDADYIYVCTAANTWKRSAIATW